MPSKRKYYNVRVPRSVCLMSDTWLVPGGPVVQENQDGASWLIPSEPIINEEAAPPVVVAPTGVFYGPLVGPLGGPL